VTLAHLPLEKLLARAGSLWKYPQCISSFITAQNFKGSWIKRPMNRPTKVKKDVFGTFLFLFARALALATRPTEHVSQGAKQPSANDPGQQPRGARDRARLRRV
jgi:hypothetical protein